MLMQMIPPSLPPKCGRRQERKGRLRHCDTGERERGERKFSSFALARFSADCGFPQSEPPRNFNGEHFLQLLLRPSPVGDHFHVVSDLLANPHHITLYLARWRTR